MAEGHRGRLRKRFLEENIDTIPDYIVLEMMLHGVISRCDTCELARTLIREFGGLPQVIDAPMHELLKIRGMGERAAMHLKLIPQYYRKYSTLKWGNSLVFNDAETVGKYMLDKLIGYENEILLAACMDTNCKLLACKPVFEGTINAVNISIRKIVEFALQFNSARVIIAHNHLSGNALPSADDLETTRQLHTALNYVGIRLDDHIIVAGDDFISLAQSGFFKK